MDDPLLKWREQFPILAKSTYLISNSLGAMPAGVRDSLASYADAWATRGVRAWETDGWWTMPVSVGDLLAPLIGACAGEVSMHQNVTLANAIILSCFDYKPPRNKIVVSELEFPSVCYLYEEQRHLGAEIVTVPTEDGIRIRTERLLEAIDERTLLVLVSHVLFRSAYIQDVAAITRRAHEVGARVVLDTYHSTGVLPYNVHTLGMDFAVGGVLKWLCGGPGASFLYVRPDLREKLRPRLVGWQAHRRPFGFEGELDLREDVWRFLNGTPNVPALYAARPGLEIINEAGVERIRAKSIRLTSLLIGLAQERGWRVHSPLDSAERGGTVTLDVPNSETVCRKLIERNFLVDYRPKAGVRIAPHFYNTEDEVRAVVEEIKL